MYCSSTLSPLSFSGWKEEGKIHANLVQYLRKACSSLTLYPWPTKALPGPSGPSPPPLSPNQSLSMGPTLPKTDLALHVPPLTEYKHADHHRPSLLAHSTPFPPLSHYPSQISIPCPVLRRRASSLNRCCELVMKLASEPDHLYPSSC
jgi:hypothetical protein